MTSVENAVLGSAFFFSVECSGTGIVAMMRASLTIDLSNFMHVLCSCKVTSAATLPPLSQAHRDEPLRLLEFSPQWSAPWAGSSTSGPALIK